MNRTMDVKGYAKVTKAPDEMQVSFSLSSISKDYKEALKELEGKQERLLKEVEVLGLKEEDLKTRDFRVFEETEEQVDENGQRKRIFKGYRMTLDMILITDLDKELLGHLLEAITQSSSEPNLHVQFSLKEPETLYEELLRKATEDAKEKAKVLAEASGVKLGDLININYQVQKDTPYSPTSFGNKLMARNSSLSFNPEDIAKEDHVTFTWLIE